MQRACKVVASLSVVASGMFSFKLLSGECLKLPKVQKCLTYFVNVTSLMIEHTFILMGRLLFLN